jgi:membrane associated rhomboid family serine protease
MNLETIFKGLIALFIFNLVMMFLFLPEDHQFTDASLTTIDIMVLLCVVLQLISLSFLPRFSHTARSVFTASTFVFVGLGFFSDEYFFPNGLIVDNLNHIIGLVSGGIIAMMYLTDLKKRFIK